MFRFETLEVWKLAIEYCDQLYEIVDKFPQTVQYNLGSQLRSSALSISNNIAEGSGSSSNHEFRSFLNYSIRSTYETVSATFIAKKRGCLLADQFNKIYQESEKLAKMIRSFRNSL